MARFYVQDSFEAKAVKKWYELWDGDFGFHVENYRYEDEAEEARNRLNEAAEQGQSVRTIRDDRRLVWSYDLTRGAMKSASAQQILLYPKDRPDPELIDHTRTLF